MREKVDPYLRPVYDALYDFMEARHVERGLSTGMIEIAPLAFMRGRTLANSVVLLDEAQNTTSMQMKMFLTRLGEGSRMIVTGDPTQIDLPPGQKSGLIEAVRISMASRASPGGVPGRRRGQARPRSPHRHRLRRRNSREPRGAPVIDVDVLVLTSAGPKSAMPRPCAPQRRGGALVLAEAPSGDVEVSVALADDATVQALNRDWRGKIIHQLSSPSRLPRRGSRARGPWATSRSRTKPSPARAETRTSSSPTMPCTSWCMGRCTFWATITNATATRP
jgi:hypothetical protein